MNRRGLIWLALFPFGLSHADVSIFEGPPGGKGNVLVLSSSGSEIRPAALQGIVLLPLDFVGRTALTGSLAGMPRLRTDVPSASRILLPKEEGSLYRFRREDPLGGPATFGFLVVGADGAAQSVFECLGTGASGSDDPFPGKIAVGPSGRSILVATTLEAGGDLWEISLVDGSAVNRTAGLDPLSFERNGLALLTNWGVGLTSAGPLRFDRVAGSLASAVPLPISAAWFGPDIVCSQDESTAAVIGGAGPTEALVFAFQASGAALQATSAPMFLSGAGFLPEYTAGPTLALSTDGSRVAWRSEGMYRDCWLRETAGTTPDVLVTGDANFDDTLNDTGVIAFYSPDSLALGVGKQDVEGIVEADLFRVDAGAGGALVITNLSGTSGVFQAPFDYGYSSTKGGMLQVSASNWLVLDEGDDDDDPPSPSRLLWVDAPGGSVLELRSEVESLDCVEPAGPFLVASLHLSSSGSPLNLLQIPPGGAPTTSLLLSGCKLSRPASLRSGNAFSAVLEFTDRQWLGRIRAPSATGAVITSSPLTFGPTVGFAKDGVVLSTVERGNAWLVFGWSDSGVEVLRPGLSAGFLLPGL